MSAVHDDVRGENDVSDDVCADDDVSGVDAADLDVGCADADIRDKKVPVPHTEQNLSMQPQEIGRCRCSDNMLW